jgi:hypothetical protein
MVDELEACIAVETEDFLAAFRSVFQGRPNPPRRILE